MRVTSPALGSDDLSLDQSGTSIQILPEPRDTFFFIKLQLYPATPGPCPTFFVVTVKLGNKERFDKEQIGIKEPFPVTNLPFTS